LIGGLSLSAVTLLKLIVAFIAGAVPKESQPELPRFAATIFGMGFLCGTVGWGGLGLSRRFGLVGDAVLGMVTMLVFFACCMLLFSPNLLTEKWSSGGSYMLAFGAVAGVVLGVWTGRDLRRWLADEKAKRPRDDARTPDDP
jgi:hypothetical protein